MLVNKLAPPNPIIETRIWIIIFITSSLTKFEIIGTKKTSIKKLVNICKTTYKIIENPTTNPNFLYLDFSSLISCSYNKESSLFLLLFLFFFWL